MPGKRRGKDGQDSKGILIEGETEAQGRGVTALVYLLDTAWSELVPELGGVSTPSSQGRLRGEGGETEERQGNSGMGTRNWEHRWGQRNRQKWGQARGSEALYLRVGRRGPGRGAPGSPAQARRRSGRSTGGGLAGGGGGNPPPIRNCLLVEGRGQ